MFLAVLDCEALQRGIAAKNLISAHVMLKPGQTLHCNGVRHTSLRTTDTMLLGRRMFGTCLWCF